MEWDCSTRPGNIRKILYIAVLPSLIGVALIALVRETKREVTKKISTTPLPKMTFKTLPRELKIFLVASGLFALGNSSDSFLILRSKDLGLSLSLVVLAYVLYNIVYTVASVPAGSLADKIGPKRVYIAGIVIYVLVYAGFAINHTTTGVWGLFAVYGLYIALTDGVSKALVGQYIDKKEAGGIYGLLQTITSVGILAASIIGGVLWSVVGPSATFVFGATSAVMALVVFAFATPNKEDYA